MRRLRATAGVVTPDGPMIALSLSANAAKLGKGLSITAATPAACRSASVTPPVPSDMNTTRIAGSMAGTSVASATRPTGPCVSALESRAVAVASAAIHFRRSVLAFRPRRTDNRGAIRLAHQACPRSDSVGKKFLSWLSSRPGRLPRLPWCCSPPAGRPRGRVGAGEPPAARRTRPTGPRLADTGPPSGTADADLLCSLRLRPGVGFPPLFRTIDRSADCLRPRRLP